MGKFTSVTRTAPGNEEPTKTPTVCCVNTCRREPIFPATRNPNWTRSRCVSINAREKLWASRLQRVNCAQVLRRPSEPAGGGGCLPRVLSIRTLEAEDQARMGYGAVLVRVEVAGVQGVRAQTYCPARFEGQVHASAEFVGESVLIAGGRLRGEVRITCQGMRPDLDAFARGPAKARTAAAKQEPGADVILRSVRRGEFTIHTEPIFPVINHAVVEAVQVLGDAGQFEETQVGVTAVQLPGVIFEYAGDVLRRWSGGYQRQGCGRGQASGRRICRGRGEWRKRYGWSVRG